MGQVRMRRYLNGTALALIAAYIVGGIALIVGFAFARMDDEYAFWFVFRYLSWGGITALVSILVLMVAKIIIVRE